MSDSTPPLLRDAAFLSALLDAFIPPSGRGTPMPGAGAIGIESAVAETIAADAQAGPAIVAALEALRERTPGFASLAAAERPPLIEALATLDSCLGASVAAPRLPRLLPTPHGAGSPRRAATSALS